METENEEEISKSNGKGNAIRMKEGKIEKGKENE